MAIKNPNNVFEQIVKQTTSPTPAPLPENTKANPDIISNFLASPSYRIAPAASKNLTALNLAMYDPGELGLETPKPVADSTFGNAFQSGLDNLSANRSYFKMLINDAFGRTEEADENLAEAQRFRGLAAEQLAGIEGPQTWEELMEAPSFSDALTYTLSTTGQFAPSAMASITAAMIGAATAAILPPVAATVGTAAAVAGGAATKGATRQAIKRLVKRAIRNKVKGEKNKATDELLDATWAYMKQVGPKQFWQTGAKHRAVMGGVAGAFSQEFTQGSGILYGDFAEQGMRGPREAGLSVLGGTAYGLIGTAGEAYVVGAVKNSFFKALKNVGSKSYFKNVAAGAGGGLWRGAVGEGAAEFGQEGVSIVQKFNIDEEYTRAMARSDAINALMAGAIGGGVIGGAGGTVSGAVAGAAPAIARKSGEYVDRFSKARAEEFIEEKLDQEELGFSIKDINRDFAAARESDEWIAAQYNTMRDPETNKEAIFIPYGTKPATREQSPIFSKEIEDDIAAGVLFRVHVPGSGVFLTTREEDAKELEGILAAGIANATAYPEDPETGQQEMFGEATNLDFFLKDALGYSNVRQPDDDLVAEVVDRQGIPVHYQSTTKEGLPAAEKQARAMFNNKLGKDQKYMFYQDFHNQKNDDGSFAMRTVETHLLDRNNNLTDSLVDQMSAVFEKDQIESLDEQPDADRDYEGGTLARSSFQWESSEQALSRTRFTEVRKDKPAFIPSWAPQTIRLKGEKLENYSKKVEEVLEVFRGRDPLFTEQDYNSILFKVSENVEKLAARGLTEKEISKKIRLPKTWDKEKMVGRPKTEVLKEMAPSFSSELDEALEQSYKFDPETQVISEANIKNMRENHVRKLVDKLGEKRANKKAKEAFPDSLLGKPIFTIVPRGILNQLLKLSKDPKFDSQNFEIVIADGKSALDTPDRYNDSIGRFVINVVSEDPAKTLGLVQDRKIVEYALAEALDSGMREGPNLDLSSLEGPRYKGMVLDISDLVQDEKLGDRGFSGVLLTQLKNAASLMRGPDAGYMLDPMLRGGLIPIDSTKLTLRGIEIMQRNGLSPPSHTLNTRQDNLQFMVAAFTTILHHLGEMGFTIKAYKHGWYARENTIQALEYDLIKAVNETFPEVAASAVTENPSELPSLEKRAAMNEKLIEINSTIEKEGTAFLELTNIEIAQALDANTIGDKIKEKLKTSKEEKRTQEIKKAASLIKLLDRQKKIKEQIDNYKPPAERIEEAVNNPRRGPEEMLEGVLDTDILALLNSTVFYRPVGEDHYWFTQAKAKKRMKLQMEYKEEVLTEEEKQQGRIPRPIRDPGAKKFKEKDVVVTAKDREAEAFTLGDLVKSWVGSPIAKQKRLLAKVNERLAQRFNKNGEEPGPNANWAKTVYHHDVGKKVKYTYDEIQVDKKLKAKLEEEIQTLGFVEKTRTYKGKKKEVWEPSEQMKIDNAKELLDLLGAVGERNIVGKDATKQDVALEIDRLTLLTEKNENELSLLKTEGKPRAEISKLEQKIGRDKSWIRKMEDFLGYDRETRAVWNVEGLEDILGSPRNGVQGAIKKIEALRQEIEAAKKEGKTSLPIIEALEILEGPKAKEYIDDQKSLRVRKYGKEKTREEVPIQVQALYEKDPEGAQWQASSIGKVYWEADDAIAPDPVYEDTPTLEEKEIAALEKQLFLDGAIFTFKLEKPVSIKTLEKKLAAFEIVDESLLHNNVLVLAEKKVDVKPRELKPKEINDWAPPSGLDTKKPSYLNKKEIQWLQDRDKERQRGDEKAWKKGYPSPKTSKRALESQEKSIIMWKKAGTLNLQEEKQRTRGYTLPTSTDFKVTPTGKAFKPHTRKKYYPNFSKAFLGQLEETTRQLGLDQRKKVWYQSTKKYMDNLFATIWDSFRMDPDVRTLVISANENIEENPALKDVDSDIKDIIKKQQYEVNRSDPTLSKEELAEGVADYGNNVFGSRIRLQGGRENIIILKIGSPTISQSGFLFSISKAFGHELGHIVLDAESDWTNNIAVIFKNRPMMKKAYLKAVADPKAPAAWKDTQNGAMEWFADNTSLFFNNAALKPKTGAESVFKRLADMFRKAWENIATYIKERFDVETEAYQLFEKELNSIIAEHKSRARQNALNKNRLTLTMGEALIVENMKADILTWENIGGKRGAEVNKTLIKGFQEWFNGGTPNSLAFIIKPVSQYLRNHVPEVGKKIIQMFYAQSQSEQVQGLLQAVTAKKNNMLTGIAGILLPDTTDADWGMLESLDPDLLAVEDSKNNTYVMEDVPVLTKWAKVVEHASARPEFTYLFAGPVPKGVKLPSNVHQIPDQNPLKIRGFFEDQYEIGRHTGSRGFIIIGKKPENVGKTKDARKEIARQIQRLNPRRQIPQLSGKKPPKNTPRTEWAYWKERYASNIGTEKGQVTAKQFKLRQAMEEFYWNNKLNIHGLPFRENYWMRMFDFVEIGAQPGLRDRLIELLVEGNTKAGTRFSRQIVLPYNSSINIEKFYNEVKEGKIPPPPWMRGGANITYSARLTIDKNGKPVLNKKGEEQKTYWQHFSMDKEVAASIVDKLADGPQESFTDMEVESEQWIGHQLGLGVLPFRSKAFAVLDTAVLRKEGLIVDPAIATDRSMSQIYKKIEYEARGGWKQVYKYMEKIEDPAEFERVLQAVKHLLGRYDQTMGPQFRTFNSWALFMNIASLLAFATFASMPDFAGPILRSKEFRAFREVVPTLMEMLKNPAEVRKFTKEIGVVASESMELMWIHAPQMDWQTMRSQKAGSFFFKWTGLEAFTKFTRYFAAGMGRRFLVHHAEKAKQGNKKSKRFLRELNNIQPSEIKKAEAANWNFGALDYQTSTNVRMALARFVDESIIRPSAAERPVWASDPRFALIWQLKSFFYAYGQNIVGGVARESISRRAETGSNIKMMAPFAMMALSVLPLTMIGWDLRERTKYAIKYAIPGQEPDWTKVAKTHNMPWGAYWIELVDRSGALGPWTMVRQMYTKAQWEELWITPLLGPTAETGEDLLRAMFTDATFNWKKRLPLGQLAE